MRLLFVFPALCAATVTLDVFPNTVLAPASAAVRSYPATVSLPPLLAPFSSVRFTGMIASPAAQSLNFSASADRSSQLRVWVDNHILLDCAAWRAVAFCASSAALPVAAGAPVQLRVELTHGAGANASLALFWQGDVTAFAEVPASALTPDVPAWEAQRVAMRERLQNPAVPWQTWTQNMAAHVLMPQGLSLDVTLRNLASGEELGDIVPWRSFLPAIVRPGLHSINGSDFTHFSLSQWGALDCSVNFSSTVVGGDLVWLLESAGADCTGLAVVFRAIIKWGYSGAFEATAPTSFVAVLPGFDNVTVALVAGAPLPAAAPPAPCNLTGSWCCGETLVAEDAAGRLTSSAGYGTGVGSMAGNNVSMVFTNAPTAHFYGYVDAPACDRVHWLNDNSSWTRAPAPPPPPFSPFSARLGAGPVVLATGRAAAALNASAAQALVAAAAARTAAWLDAAEPGLRDAFEPLSAVLLWDTVFTPYLTAVTASSRLWVCTGGNPACEQTGYTIFNWDMPMCAWTWAGLSSSTNGLFAKDMAYAQLIEDAYTRTMLGFVPNYSSGTFASADRTQPPLFGFVAMQLFAQYGEAWLLEALFDPLTSYLDFLWNYRRGAGVFAGSDGRVALFSWGSNNFTGGDDAACTKQAASYESGLDDSPMWDEAGWSPCAGGLGLMTLYDAGLTGLFLSESAALIAIARAIGRGDAVPLLQARFDATAAAMNKHLWNESRGFFNNVQWDGTPSVHLSPTSYYPLMAGPGSGAVSAERAAAMVATLASPLGMCLNATAHGAAGPFAATTSRWVKDVGNGGAQNTATCASQACIADLVLRHYALAPTASLGAVALNVSAAAALPALVPLANWRSPLRLDTALTNSTSSPPRGDASYALLRLEGYCLPSAASAAALPGAPAAAPVTSWLRGNDTAACSSPACEADMAARGYAPQGTLCWAVAAAALEDYPCAYGAPSVSRGDPQFDRDGTGYYWRGRVWPATEGTLYWALMAWADEPGVAQARRTLAAQARALADFHWRAWGAVCENAHAILGTCAEMASSGAAGDDDPLLNWSGIGPYLSIVEQRRGRAAGAQG